MPFNPKISVTAWEQPEFGDKAYASVCEAFTPDPDGKTPYALSYWLDAGLRQPESRLGVSAHYDDRSQGDASGGLRERPVGTSNTAHHRALAFPSLVLLRWGGLWRCATSVISEMNPKQLAWEYRVLVTPDGALILPERWRANLREKHNSFFAAALIPPRLSAHRRLLAEEGLAHTINRIFLYESAISDDAEDIPDVTVTLNKAPA